MSSWGLESSQSVHGDERGSSASSDKGGGSRSFDEMITIDLVETTLTIRLQTCLTSRLSNR